jgi:hypothetical protein
MNSALEERRKLTALSLFLRTTNAFCVAILAVIQVAAAEDGVALINPNREKRRGGPAQQLRRARTVTPELMYDVTGERTRSALQLWDATEQDTKSRFRPGAWAIHGP